LSVIVPRLNPCLVLSTSSPRVLARVIWGLFGLWVPIPPYGRITAVQEPDRRHSMRGGRMPGDDAEQPRGPSVLDVGEQTRTSLDAVAL